MLLAVRRTDPPDSTYYFHPADVAETGFRATPYFGRASGQDYRVILLIMDADDAREFYDSHSGGGGSYAFSDSIPPGAKEADRVSVRQTSTDCVQ